MTKSINDQVAWESIVEAYPFILGKDLMKEVERLIQTRLVERRNPF